MRRALGMAVVGLLALAGCGGPSTYEELGMHHGKPLKAWIELLRDGDEVDKERASKVLSAIGAENDDLVPALRKLLKHEDGFVRAAACHILGQIGPKAKAAYPDLCQCLEDKDKRVLIQANYAIPRVGQ